MKKHSMISLVLALMVLVSGVTACGKTNEQTNEQTNGKACISTLAEAKAAIKDGAYEEAYRYLMTDNSAEATELLSKLVFVPVRTETVKGDYPHIRTFQYDEQGNLLSQRVSGGTDDVERWRGTYDEQGRLITSNDLGNNLIYRLTYDDNGVTVTDKDGDFRCRYEKGLLVSEGYGPCIDECDGYRLRYYSYNDRGQVTAESIRCPVCGVSEEYIHSFDAAGRLLKDKENTYAYDAQGNMVLHLKGDDTQSEEEWTRYTYTYDANGNKIKEEYAHYKPGYTMYDGDVVDPVSQEGSTVYTYDNKNRLIKAEGNGYWQDKYLLADSSLSYSGSGDLGNYTMEYTYDAQDRMIEQEFECFYKYSDNEQEDEYIYRKQTATYGKNGAYTAIVVDENNVTLGKTIVGENGNTAIWHNKVNEKTGQREWILQFAYTYDEFGNLVRQDSYGGTATSITEYELRYYPNGFPSGYIDEKGELWPMAVTRPALEKRLTDGSLTQEEIRKYEALLFPG